MGTLNVLISLGMIFLQIGTGAFLRKLRLLKESTPEILNAIIFNVAMPIMLFCSLYGDITAKTLRQAGRMAVIAMCMILAGHFLSYAYARLLRLNNTVKGVHQFVFVVPNVAFLGVAVAKAVWGEEALLFVSVFTLVSTIYMSSLGVLLLNSKAHFSVKSILTSPLMIGSALGLVAGLLHLPIPHVVFAGLTQIGGITTPLAMFFTGYTLLETNFFRLIRNREIMVTTITRLVIIPLVTYGVMRRITNDYYYYAIPAVMTAMPGVSLMPIFAYQYGGDVKTASSLAIVTPLFAIITLPALILFLFMGGA
jgi:predicted permease